MDGRLNVYPYHQNGLPDVPDAVVNQPRRIDELVLVHRLRIGTQRLHGGLHLLREPRHHCTHEESREGEKKSQATVGGTSRRVRRSRDHHRSEQKHPGDPRSPRGRTSKHIKTIYTHKKDVGVAAPPGGGGEECLYRTFHGASQKK